MGSDERQTRRSVDGIAPGTLISDKYRVERVLGTGGMGVVVAAIHVQLRDRVAIKLLRVELQQNDVAVARFLREAQVAARIKGEHVGRVLDVGMFDGRVPYIVMEYLKGSDLSEILAERGPLAMDVAVGYVLQACEALAEAHAHGIVHRDLKPANLFVAKRPDGSGAIKVLDFGISKLLPTIGGQDQAITQTASILGSPLYMSPEQLKAARDVDVRTDIWSLGVILFELLTGKPPFFAETFAQLGVKILQEQAPTLSTLIDDVPQGLERAVARCLEKDVDARYPTVAELAVALAEFVPVVGPLSAARTNKIWHSRAALDDTLRPPIEADLTSPARENVTGAPWSASRAKKERRASKAIVVAGVLTGIGVATGGALLLQRFLKVPPVLSQGIPLDAAPSVDGQPLAQASDATGPVRLPIPSSSAEVVVPADAGVPVDAALPADEVSGPIDGSLQLAVSPALPRAPIFPAAKALIGKSSPSSAAPNAAGSPPSRGQVESRPAPSAVRRDGTLPADDVYGPRH